MLSFYWNCRYLFSLLQHYTAYVCLYVIIRSPWSVRFSATAICAGSLTKIIFVMPKYNYCSYQWIFKITILQNRQKIYHSIYLYTHILVKMTNFSYLLEFMNRKISFSSWILLLMNFWLLSELHCASSNLGKKGIQTINYLINKSGWESRT